MGQRRRRPHPTRADQRRPSHHQTLYRSQIYCDLQWNSVATKQPPDPLTEPDLLRFTMEQRRRRPEPTSADQATTRPSNGARSTAIYNGTASPAPTPDQSRPAPTKQPPDPLTEPDLLRFTMEQSRRRPHPTRAKPPPDPLTEPDLLRFTMTRAKPPPDPLTEPDLLRFTMEQRRRRPTPDQSRPAPTKQPPDPLTEPDLLRFTMEQRRRRHTRPEPTSADQATTRPSNGARSTAIYNGTASPAPTPDQSRAEPTSASVAGAHTRPEPTSADQATTRPSNGARSTAIYNGTALPAPTPDQSRPAPTKPPPDPLTEPDLLRFTMEQRRRRPHPTRADQATTRPSKSL